MCVCGIWVGLYDKQELISRRGKAGAKRPQQRWAPLTGGTVRLRFAAAPSSPLPLNAKGDVPLQHLGLLHPVTAVPLLILLNVILHDFENE